MKKLYDKRNAALLCIMVAVFFGFTALTIDIGLVYTEGSKLSNALHSAALAASFKLPGSEYKAKAAAIEYLKRNSVDTDDTIITIAKDGKSIEIEQTKTVKLLFAPLIGIDSRHITVRSKATISSVKKVMEKLQF